MQNLRKFYLLVIPFQESYAPKNEGVNCEGRYGIQGIKASTQEAGGGNFQDESIEKKVLWQQLLKKNLENSQD